MLLGELVCGSKGETVDRLCDTHLRNLRSKDLFVASEDGAMVGKTILPPIVGQRYVFHLNWM